MEDRDRRDRERADSPLKQADEAHFIDTTNRTADEVISEIADIAREKGLA